MKIIKQIESFKHFLGTARVFLKEYQQWQRLANHVTACDCRKNKLVIIPCDPFSVGGSRGDEAMIMAVIQHYRKKETHIPITIVSGSDEGLNYVQNMPVSGIMPLNVWTGDRPLERIVKAVLSQNPSYVVLLGADCMDGFYSPFISLTLLALHDIFTRTPGIESRLMGFSFNAKPYWLMRKAFCGIHKDTCLNLRDSVSLERFRKNINMPAGLVADAAFMLQPDSDFQGFYELENWINDRRKIAERYIIGMNFHPMLRKYNNSAEIREDAFALARNVEIILKENPAIDFVLIPHDDRSCITDNLMLGTMAEYLSNQGKKDRFYYKETVYHASQLKGLCSLLDGLVSSRMHLAIAALGMGIPVMAATYQGKFEGLFRHFMIDESFLLEPQEFLSNQMVKCFYCFINELSAMKLQIKKQLPLVLELSQNNFNK